MINKSTLLPTRFDETLSISYVNTTGITRVRLYPYISFIVGMLRKMVPWFPSLWRVSFVLKSIKALPFCNFGTLVLLLFALKRLHARSLNSLLSFLDVNFNATCRLSTELTSIPVPASLNISSTVSSKFAAVVIASFNRMKELHLWNLKQIRHLMIVPSISTRTPVDPGGGGRVGFERGSEGVFFRSIILVY